MIIAHSSVPAVEKVSTGREDQNRKKMEVMCLRPCFLRHIPPRNLLSSKDAADETCAIATILYSVLLASDHQDSIISPPYTATCSTSATGTNQSGAAMGKEQW